MRRTGPAIEPDASVPPPRWRHGFTLAIALLALALAWVPGLGLLLALTGLVMGIWGLRHKARPRSSGWAVALSALALVLGGIFTGLTLFLTPPETAEERRIWEEFDRTFTSPVGGEGREDEAAPEDKAP